MKRVRLARRVAALESEPDLSEYQKAAIVRAIRWGLEEVSRRWPGVAAAGREEELTAKLCDVLCEQDSAGKRRAPGLSLFETVVRGGKTEAASGRIEYQPDLTFRPIAAPSVRNRTRWGWFVECKVIDGASSVRLYCKHGVQRFVDGRYAPRMPSAALLGYVRDERQAHPALSAALEDEYGCPIELPPRRRSWLIRSCHDRTKAQVPCVAIQLTHLWLRIG